jgi:hypothetical protein
MKSVDARMNKVDETMKQVCGASTVVDEASTLGRTPSASVDLTST